MQPSRLELDLDGGLARPLTGAGVGSRTLAAHRKSFAVAKAAIAAEVHQPLDRHRHLAAKITFHREALHTLAQPVELGVVQVLDLARTLHARGGTDRLCSRPADAIDGGQRDLGVLVVRDVDACYTCHTVVPLGNPRL